MSNIDSLDHLEITDNVPDTGRPDGYAPTWDEWLKQFQEAEGGRWITINGAHVFIKDGQTITQALEEQQRIKDRLSGKTQPETPQPPSEIPQPEIPQQPPSQFYDVYADSKDMYQHHSDYYSLENTKDALDARQKYWAKSDEDNMNANNEWRRANSAESMITYYKLRAEKGVGDPAQNQKDLQEQEQILADARQKYEALKEKLTKSGRFEPAHVGFYLNEVAELKKDLQRRKVGSSMHTSQTWRLKRLEKEIDDVRTMRNPRDEDYDSYDDKKARDAERRQERIAQNEQHQQERQQKIEQEQQKHNQDSGVAFDAYKTIMAKYGIDASIEDSPQNDIRAKINEIKPSLQDQLKAFHNNDPKQHSINTKKLQDYHEAKAAHAAYKYYKSAGSYYEKRYKTEWKDAEWERKNLVTDHKVYGVNIYSDNKDKERTNIQIQKLLAAPELTRNILRNVHLKEGAGEIMRGAGQSFRAGGYWDKGKSILKSFYNAKKWDKVYGESIPHGTTMDHEVAHATYDAVKAISEAPQPQHTELVQAFNNFNDVAERTGRSKGFKLHSYTDGYYKTGDKRRNTETHSKLREMEVDGTLEQLESDIEKARNVYKNPRTGSAEEKIKDYDELHSIDYRLNSEENVQHMGDLIEAYRNFRKMVTAY